jgi:hypothetical protein
MMQVDGPGPESHAVLANVGRLDWTDRGLGNQQSTLLGVSVRAFPEMIDVWASS